MLLQGNLLFSVALSYINFYINNYIWSKDAVTRRKSTILDCFKSYKNLYK